MAEIDEERVLRLTAIVLDSAAMNDAFLSGDYDESRFRAHLLVAKADVAGLTELALAAAFAIEQMGPVGTQPLSGVAFTLIRIAEAIDSASGFYSDR